MNDQGSLVESFLENITEGLWIGQFTLQDNDNQFTIVIIAEFEEDAHRQFDAVIESIVDLYD